jgi:hypothetical protein
MLSRNKKAKHFICIAFLREREIKREKLSLSDISDSEEY